MLANRTQLSGTSEIESYTACLLLFMLLPICLLFIYVHSPIPIFMMKYKKGKKGLEIISLIFTTSSNHIMPLSTKYERLPTPNTTSNIYGKIRKGFVSHQSDQYISTPRHSPPSTKDFRSFPSLTQ